MALRYLSAQRLALATVTAFVLSGCHHTSSLARNTPEPSTQDGPTYNNSSENWPFKFYAHLFGSACYSTRGCEIRYGRYSRSEPRGELAISSSSVAHIYPHNLSAGWGPIRNFPPPALIEWQSSDGTKLHAEIDIASIFSNFLILHHAKREEVTKFGFSPFPEIIIEVNDRTINVYMRATIWIKESPANLEGKAKRDMITAFSRTY